MENFYGRGAAEAIFSDYLTRTYTTIRQLIAMYYMYMYCTSTQHCTQRPQSRGIGARSRSRAAIIAAVAAATPARPDRRAGTPAAMAVAAARSYSASRAASPSSVSKSSSTSESGSASLPSGTGVCLFGKRRSSCSAAPYRFNGPYYRRASDAPSAPRTPAHLDGDLARWSEEST
jgi:hypothetical protein